MNWLASNTIITIIMSVFSFVNVKETNTEKRNELNELLTIGINANNLISEAIDLEEISEGILFVSDKLEYCVKKFDSDGKLVDKFGKRGTDKGEFKAPGKLTASKEFIAVADFASFRVQIFSKNFNYANSLYTEGVIFDINFDFEGYLWVRAYTSKKNKTLFKYDIKGKLLKIIPLKYSTGDEFNDIFNFTISESGDIIVAYLFLNKIEVWKTTGEFMHEFDIQDLPKKPKYEKMPMGLFSSKNVPKGIMIGSISMNKKGAIYILCGHYTKNPFRDVYISDLSGKIINNILLPRASSQIYINKKDEVYTIENKKTIIRKYNIE
jgi:hypothetical protein